MDRELQGHPLSVLVEVGIHPLAIGQEQVLADLAPRAKVVQTVVCSTFTRGAKPATRRVADGERMNPQGKGGAYAPIRRRRAPGRRAPCPRRRFAESRTCGLSGQEQGPATWMATSRSLNKQLVTRGRHG
jgi:hypothetical protein